MWSLTGGPEVGDGTDSGRKAWARRRKRRTRGDGDQLAEGRGTSGPCFGRERIPDLFQMIYKLVEEIAEPNSYKLDFLYFLNTSEKRHPRSARPSLLPCPSPT